MESDVDLELKGASQVPPQTTFKPTEGPFTTPAVEAPTAANTDYAVSQPVVQRTPAHFWTWGAQRLLDLLERLCKLIQL